MIKNSSKIHKVFFRTVAICFITSLWQIHVFAEVKYEVYDIKFNVEELQKIDSNSYELKLTKNSEKIIIPAVSLPTYLAEYFFFGNNVSNYKIQDLLKFTNNAFIQNDVASFDLGLKSLSVSPYDFLNQDIEVEQQIKILTDALKKDNKLNPNTTNKSLLFRVYLESIDESDLSESKLVKEELVPELNRILKSEENLRVNTGKYIEDNLKRKLELNLVLKAKNIIKEVLPLYKDLSKETSKLIAIDTVISRIDDISLSSDEESLSKITKELKDNYLDISNILSGFYENKLKDLTTKQIESGNYLDAIKTILSSDFDKRTPITHENLEKSLTKISEEESFELTNDDNRLANLILFARKDDKLRSLILEKIFKNIHQKISIDKLYEAEILYSNLIQNLKDTDILSQSSFIHEFDSLIISFADSYLRKGDLKHAEEKIRDLSSNNSLNNILAKLSIKFYSFGKLRYLFLILPFLLLGIVSYLLLKKKRKSVKLPNKVFQSSSNLEVDEQGYTRTYEKKSFVNPVARKTNPMIQEYLDCINAIDVKAGATEKEIKIAFRNKAKVLHPDAAGTTSTEVDPNEFLELQKKYNRLLELERQYSFSTQDFLKED